MTDRDAVCWHCLDCVTVPARTRCEHCPEECDVEGCDAPGCNGQVATVSPWRSLKDDPPEPPTEETNHALLVRASPLDRDLVDDRYRLLVPYQDRDNGNRWRWFDSHLDDVMEDFIAWGYSEWMEVPE